MAPTIFVCGATGCQGGATARALLTRGASVHSLARNPDSPSALTIKDLGVRVTPGDFDNKPALEAAIKGCTAVFLNFMPDFTDLAANLRQAKLIMSVAKDAGVTHVVYTSGLGVDRIHDIPAVEKGSMIEAILQSKRDIELAVQEAGFPTWTVLRPGNFMANYTEPFVQMYTGLTTSGVWVGATNGSVLLPMTDTTTIGLWSSEALLNPQRFSGKTIHYADEKLSLDTVFEKLRRATGKNLKFVPMSKEDMEAQKASPFISGQKAMAEMDKLIDMEEPKSWGLPLSTFDKFLEREKDALDKTYAKVPTI